MFLIRFHDCSKGGENHKTVFRGDGILNAMAVGVLIIRKIHPKGLISLAPSFEDDGEIVHTFTVWHRAKFLGSMHIETIKQKNRRGLNENQNRG